MHVWLSEELDDGRNGENGSKGPRGALGFVQLLACSAPAVCKESTRLITVMLKTSIFISNPCGAASLAYLLAVLAVFLAFGCAYLISLLCTRLRDPGPSSGKAGYDNYLSTTRLAELLPLLPVSSGASLGSSWRPGAVLGSAPLLAGPAGGRTCGVYLPASVPSVASSFQAQAVCGLACRDADRCLTPGRG